MTLLMREQEKYREGIERGREEGRQAGREESRREDIKYMLSNHKTPEQIADFCGYDLEMVRRVKNEL